MFFRIKILLVPLVELCPTASKLRGFVATRFLRSFLAFIVGASLATWTEGAVAFFVKWTLSSGGFSPISVPVASSPAPVNRL